MQLPSFAKNVIPHVMCGVFGEKLGFVWVAVHVSILPVFAIFVVVKGGRTFDPRTFLPPLFGVFCACVLVGGIGDNNNIDTRRRFAEEGEREEGCAEDMVGSEVFALQHWMGVWVGSC